MIRSCVFDLRQESPTIQNSGWISSGPRRTEAHRTWYSCWYFAVLGLEVGQINFEVDGKALSNLINGSIILVRARGT